MALAAALSKVLSTCDGLGDGRVSDNHLHPLRYIWNVAVPYSQSQDEVKMTKRVRTWLYDS